MTENNITLREIAEILKNKDRLYFICHVRPDGDTLACAFALKEALEKMGKQIAVFSSDPVSDRLSFICSSKVFLPEQAKNMFTPELIVTLDVASNSMLGDCKELLTLADSVKIDHHSSDDKFALYTYSDPESASCSEIIFDLINILEIPMSDSICATLYAGISFDTGCFKHSNVTESTLLKTAKLISRNVDSADINSKLFGNKTQKEITALKLAYNSLEYYADGKIAVISIDNDDKAQYGLTDDDIADLAQIPIEIDGVLLGITVKEKESEPCRFKVSMRSKKGTSAENVCKAFGGGGHVCAAGCLVVADTKREAIERIVEIACKEVI